MSKVKHKAVQWYGDKTTITLCEKILNDSASVDENNKVTCKRCLAQIRKKKSK